MRPTTDWRYWKLAACHSFRFGTWLECVLTFGRDHFQRWHLVRVCIKNLRWHLGELSADDREECLQIIQPMGRRCKMVDHVAKGKFFVVAQQTKSGGSACLPNLVEKEHKIKKEN